MRREMTLVEMEMGLLCVSDAGKGTLKRYLDEVSGHVEAARKTLAALRRRDADETSEVVFDELCAAGLEMGAAAEKIGTLMKKMSNERMPKCLRGVESPKRSGEY